MHQQLRSFDYSAEKVFLEGDAVILAISEREDAQQEWYCVARACGLASSILQIVQQYNSKSEKHQLPVLELGIGISYTNSAPTFLFDESHRIIISPAINAADRMARCTKPLCRENHNPKYPFNLYVFRTASEDDSFLRFIVNGIELNAEGFKKLSQEIDLQSFNCHIPKLQTEKIKVHTGKFQTKTGKYQRLIIREARIPIVSPNDFSIIRKTDQKYFEVCTHALLYDYVEKL